VALTAEAPGRGEETHPGDGGSLGEESGDGEGDEEAATVVSHSIR